MPSPFPGMDPYLENPLYWRGFHELLISAMTAQLNVTLPEGFAANMDERLYVLYEERALYPDIALLRLPRNLSEERAPTRTATLPGAASAATEERTEDAALEATLLPREERESYIEVLQLGHGDVRERLVALIEVLSPANKTAGTGRAEYQRKQHSVFESSTHLLEIDLLRSGRHTVAVPEDVIFHQNEGRWFDSLVCLHPAGKEVFYRFWPRTVRQVLPCIRIPLSDGVEGPLLDLQSAFDRAYDAGPYRRRVDYRIEPDPPLRSEDAAWAEALLREKGLRS